MLVTDVLRLLWNEGTGGHVYGRITNVQMQSHSMIMMDKWRRLWQCGERVSICI